MSHALLEKVRAMKTEAWPKEDRIDWLLFRSQLEQFDFDESRPKVHAKRIRKLYIGECVNGIFSLLKKEYDTPQKRAPGGDRPAESDASHAQTRPENLQSPVKL